MPEDREGDRAKKNQAILEKLQALKKTYAQQLVDRCRQIEDQWRELMRAWDREILVSLERAAHSLTGSGKSYGFPDVSIHARNLEMCLKLFIEEKLEPTSERKEEADSLVETLLRVLKDASESV